MVHLRCALVVRVKAVQLRVKCRPVQAELPRTAQLDELGNLLQLRCHVLVAAVPCEPAAKCGVHGSGIEEAAEPRRRVDPPRNSSGDKVAQQARALPPCQVDDCLVHESMFGVHRNATVASNDARAHHFRPAHELLAAVKAKERRLVSCRAAD